MKENKVFDLQGVDVAIPSIFPDLTIDLKMIFLDLAER